MLYLHNYFSISNNGKENKFMFIKSFIEGITNNYIDISNNTFDKVDPNLIRYFRTEYGRDWKVALEHYLYKKEIIPQHFSWIIIVYRDEIN